MDGLRLGFAPKWQALKDSISRPRGIEIPDALSLINSLAIECCNHVVLMILPVGDYILPF
jgi:hypothetical protein